MVKYMYFFFFFFFFFLSFCLFAVNFNHVLNSMISMEFIVISNCLIIFIFYSNFLSESIMLYFLMFSVLESVMGLSLIISLNYFHGSEYIKMMNLGN